MFTAKIYFETFSIEKANSSSELFSVQKIFLKLKYNSYGNFLNILKFVSAKFCTSYQLLILCYSENDCRNLHFQTINLSTSTNWYPQPYGGEMHSKSADYVTCPALNVQGGCWIHTLCVSWRRIQCLYVMRDYANLWQSMVASSLAQDKRLS
jgi:hypothetical protein